MGEGGGGGGGGGGVHMQPVVYAPVMSQSYNDIMNHGLQ